MHRPMHQNPTRKLAFFGFALLFWVVPVLVANAQENSNAFRSRAISNGEYVLLEPTAGRDTDASLGSQPDAAGGASMADFSMLMSLIQTTVDPDLWESGDATMQAYPGGIFLDATGVVRRCKVSPSLGLTSATSSLNTGKRSEAKAPNTETDWLQITSRRVVSLKRLFRAVDDYATRGWQWNRELATVAALHRIDFVVLDPLNQDLLLIGPAGGEVEGRNGTWFHTETETSPILLQDLLAISTAFHGKAAPVVMCSLDPTADGIARVHALLNQPDAASRLVRNPNKGAEELAKTMGMHQVSISGLEPSSPTALALLEADIHMKRLGLGLEQSAGSLTSYPDWSEKLGLQPSGQLLRWWFMPDYPEIQCNAEKTIFAIPARRVRLQSERQMMDAEGNRNAAGQADKAADRFAEQFTSNFSAIQKQFPLYGRLSHIFDIAIACKLAIEHSEWHAAVEFDSNIAGQVPKAVAPTTATGKWKNGTQSHHWIVVSGGVELDLRQFDLKPRLKSEDGGTISRRIGQSQPKHDARTYWWWDEPYSATE